MVANNIPMVIPICGTLPNNPRRLAGAYSKASSNAPPHSPPMATPCRIRKKNSRIGAHSPMLE